MSARANVWTDTDPDRTGVLDFVFDEGFGYESYVDYALSVPMYFVKRDDYIDASGQNFRDFLNGKLPAFTGEYPTLKDWQDHLTTLFPEVRLKSYLEMRGADLGPWDRICALPALWAGLLYDQGALDQASALIKDWSLSDIHKLRGMAAKSGLKGEIAGRPVKDWALDMLEIAKTGLRVRAALSGGLVDETSYLDTLFEIATSGLTPADRLLEAYYGPWKGDIRNLYVDQAY